MRDVGHERIVNNYAGRAGRGGNHRRDGAARFRRRRHNRLRAAHATYAGWRATGMAGGGFGYQARLRDDNCGNPTRVQNEQRQAQRKQEFLQRFRYTTRFNAGEAVRHPRQHRHEKEQPRTARIHKVLTVRRSMGAAHLTSTRIRALTGTTGPLPLSAAAVSSTFT